MGLPEVLDEMEVVVGIAPVMDGCHAPPIATNRHQSEKTDLNSTSLAN